MRLLANSLWSPYRHAEHGSSEDDDGREEGEIGVFASDAGKDWNERFQVQVACSPLGDCLVDDGRVPSFSVDASGGGAVRRKI